jgi:hypothetical protein
MGACEMARERSDADAALALVEDLVQHGGQILPEGPVVLSARRHAARASSFRPVK